MVSTVSTTILYTFRVNSQEYGQIINALLATGNPKALKLAEEMRKYRERFRVDMLRQFTVDLAQKEILEEP